jgi:GNAT superfamily N-acetyltransferase
VHEDLAQSGWLVPLASRDAQVWSDCDLASLAENRLGCDVDPFSLDATRRRELSERATTEPLRPPKDGHQRHYWIVHDGKRAGTLAVESEPLGRATLRLSSLYLLPAFRRRGVGRDVLERTREVLATHGLGIRLETNWTWQGAVAFYLSFGMWVRMWKREIDFHLPCGAPRPIITIGKRAASIAIEEREGPRVLAKARRKRDALVLEEATLTADNIDSVAHDADGTLALAIAMKGWPLVRSESERASYKHWDAGPPEALAHKIEIWEAWARRHSWVVRTPRIPGILYQDWEEID